MWHLRVITTGRLVIVLFRLLDCLLCVFWTNQEVGKKTSTYLELAASIQCIASTNARNLIIISMCLRKALGRWGWGLTEFKLARGVNGSK